VTRLFEAAPFVIVEVGSNWQTLEHCLKSIEVAKECGADAAKFQVFDYEDLYGFHPHGYDLYSASSHPMVQIKGWLPELKAKADAVGIELMVTAFSPELVAAVDPYVSVHKIASSDAAWPQMLEAVAKTQKPVLVSFGGKMQDEIDTALSYLADARGSWENILPLYCVAAYPADFYDLAAARRFFGISDHTLGYTAVVEAWRNGAHCIEKHFTAFPDLGTPDRPHSLTPQQFKRMVDILRDRPVETEEAAMFLRHNRRLIATRDIHQGEMLLYGQNYGAYRAFQDCEGRTPFSWKEIEGSAAAKAYRRGDCI
jgi:sialic acid synthase SpsE